jgi:hypothetical protein
MLFQRSEMFRAGGHLVRDRSGHAWRFIRAVTGLKLPNWVSPTHDPTRPDRGAEQIFA